MIQLSDVQNNVQKLRVDPGSFDVIKLSIQESFYAIIESADQPSEKMKILVELIVLPVSFHFQKSLHDDDDSILVPMFLFVLGSGRRQLRLQLRSSLQFFERKCVSQRKRQNFQETLNAAVGCLTSMSQ